MTKVRKGQKPDRVFKFLMGLRHPKVARAMAAFGFSDADLKEAWRRLDACEEFAKVEERAADTNPKLVAGLDAFENVWFPVAKATLKGNYPGVYEALFANLWQSSGRDAAMTVGTFLKRMREMEAGSGAYAAEGAAARALLAARGLTESVVAEAEALIASVKTTVKTDDSTVNNKEEYEKAVAHLWAWYLEWSAIARVAVKDRRLLRSMGFLSTNGNGKATEEEELFDEDTSDAAAETPDAPDVDEDAEGKGDGVAAE